MLVRTEAISLLRDKFGDVGINWDAFNPDHPTSSEGECTLWMLAHAIDDAPTRNMFYSTFTCLVRRDLSNAHHLPRGINNRKKRRVLIHVEQERIKAIVTTLHPQIDMGQRLPQPTAA